MIDLRRYEKLKGDVERLQREVGRAEGALLEQERRLADYGCGCLEEAEEELKRIEAELSRMKSKYKAELEEFEESFSKVFGSSSGK